MIILKRIIYYLFIFLCITFCNNVYANDNCLANAVRVDYTYKEDFNALKNKKIEKDKVFFYYYINITNLNDSNYITIKNNYNNKKVKITSDNFKNGVATYEWTVFNKEVEFTINIYTNDETCTNQKIRTLKLITPKLNNYYLDDQCRKIPDFEMCQPFYETDINYSEFYNSVNVYRKKHKMKTVSEFDTTKTGKILDFLKNNIFSSTVFIVIIIGLIGIIISKNKKIKS